MTPLNSPPYFLLFAHNLLQSVHLVFPFSSLSSSGTRATWTIVASGVSVLQNRALPKKNMICIVDFSPTTLFSQQQVSRLWRRILLLMPIEMIQAEKGVLTRLHFQAFKKTHGTICVRLQRRDVTPGLRPDLHAQQVQVWRCRARRDCPKVDLSITKCTLMVNVSG